jgi:transposase-like protein
LKALKNPVKLKQAKIGESSSRTKRRKTGEKRYSNCSGIGHNVKICEIVSSLDKETESDQIKLIAIKLVKLFNSFV